MLNLTFEFTGETTWRNGGEILGKTKMEPLMDAVASLLCLQELTAGPCPEPH
jgi:hypothetical protein